MPTDTTERVAPAGSELQTLVVVSGAHLISHLHIMVLPVLLPLLKDQLQVGFFELGRRRTSCPSSAATQWVNARSGRTRR